MTEDPKVVPQPDGTYPMPDHGWTCFHCGENFKKFGAALDHFGATPEATAGCLLKIAVGDERGLLMALRKTECQRDEFRVRAAALRIGVDEEECVLRFQASRDDAP